MLLFVLYLLACLPAQINDIKLASLTLCNWFTTTVDKRVEHAQ